MESFGRIVVVAGVILVICAVLLVNRLFIAHNRIVTQTKPIAYSTNLEVGVCVPKGKTEVGTPGVNGIETIKYEVTYVNGKQISKHQISDSVTSNPTPEVLVVGTASSAFTESAGCTTSIEPLQQTLNNDVNGIINPAQPSMLTTH